MGGSGGGGQCCTNGDGGAGGAGGSGFAGPTATNVNLQAGLRAGDGLVTITFTAPAAPVVVGPRFTG
jgi:hypothetical protein